MSHNQDAEMSDGTVANPAVRSSSPLNFPSSGGPLNAAIPANNVRSSSPLRFPTDTPVSRGERTPRATQLRNSEVSSPLQYPTSSPRRGAPGSSARRLFSEASAAAGQQSDEPLFFSPGSDGTPRPRNRRGDIHSSQPPTSPSAQRTRRRDGGGAPMSDVTRLASDPTLSAQQPPSDAIGEDGMVKVIWGTNVGINESLSAFREFLRGFKPKYRRDYDRKRGISVPALADPSTAEQSKYEALLRKMRLTSQTNLNLDLRDLDAYPPSRKLYSQVQKYPQEIIPIMDQALKDTLIELSEEDAEADVDGLGAEAWDDELGEMGGRVYKVRPFGLNAINMRDLNPQDTDKLVAVKGLVIRATSVIPDMKNAFFRCLVCGHTHQVEIDRGRIAEPDRCPRAVCNLQGTMSLIHNRSEFADKQVVRLQETPDAVPDGQTPHTVSLCVYDELVDLSKPGDRVTVMGIFRSLPVRVNPRQRAVKSLYKTYLDVVHVKRSDAHRMGFDPTTREGAEGKVPVAVGVGGEEEEEAEAAAREDSAAGRSTIAAELEEKLKEVAAREDAYELLARSLAPSIWEMDDVKKGILLQLFGGTNKSIARGGGGGGPRYRGDINVLLVGDPGTSKSQILQYVHKIAPRGVYTSGKGSSAVGLTAYVTRDPDSKQLVLESGALVLSDGGVCCIDEFDKMSDATRSVLHEVMEQQTVSIAKAGIITTLNARTSILAAANPVGSKYNLQWPITRNIDLPPTLISRFDLLYLVLDQINESNDRRLAKHLIGMYLEDAMETAGTDILSLETLTAYITYARNKINPVLSANAADELVKQYVALRQLGEDPRSSERRITATTRQLESMIRLSEAHARMRFSDRVELQDVQEAVRLIREALKESATDPSSGLIDMDLLTTGQGLHGRRQRSDLKKEILAILDSGRTMRWDQVSKALNDQSSVNVDPTEFGEVVRSLETDGLVKITGSGERRTIRKTSR